DRRYEAPNGRVGEFRPWPTHSRQSPGFNLPSGLAEWLRYAEASGGYPSSPRLSSPAFPLTSFHDGLVTPPDDVRVDVGLPANYVLMPTGVFYVFAVCLLLQQRLKRNRHTGINRCL